MQPHEDSPPMVADELRGIACQGLTFAQSEYDRQRYHGITGIVARMLNLGDLDTGIVLPERLDENLWHISPIAGAEAVVVKDGRLLLIRRADDGL